MPRQSRVWVISVALALQAGCSPDNLGRKIALLEQSDRREQVIDELLAEVRRVPAKRRGRVKERVVYALMEAYRQDVRRGQIVAALALLRDPRAEEVFVAAVKDGKRGGPYFEAALRAARLLGQLRLKGAVPHLVAALEAAQRSKPSEQTNLLKRALIEALRQLGDRRAVPTLVAVLRAEPLQQDMELTRLAAEALGELRAVDAVPSLVGLLGGTRHGLLLFEASRRALCRVGPAASGELLARVTKRDKRGRLGPVAAGAVDVLADLADRSALGSETIVPLAVDPPSYRLAAAVARLRWRPDEQAESWLLALLQRPEIGVADRCRAAELLGWYGSARALAALGELLTRRTEQAIPRQLLGAAMLAHSRLGGGPAAAKKEIVGQAGQDERSLSAYAERLEVINRCPREGQSAAEQVDCLLGSITEQRGERWRARERAALEVGRRPLALPLTARVALALARVIAGAEDAKKKPSPGVRTSKIVDAARRREAPRLHPQVALAALISLERLERLLWGQKVSQQVADIVDQGLQSPGRLRASNRSRARCMVERLRRRGTEKHRTKDSE